MARLTETELEAIAQARVSGIDTIAASEQVTGLGAADLQRLAEIERAKVMRQLGRSLALSVRTAVRRYAPGIVRWHLRRATERELAALDDRTLRDIGVTRAEIAAVARADAARSVPPGESVRMEQTFRLPGALPGDQVARWG